LCRRSLAYSFLSSRIDLTTVCRVRNIHMRFPRAWCCSGERKRPTRSSACGPSVAPLMPLRVGHRTTGPGIVKKRAWTGQQDTGYARGANPLSTLKLKSAGAIASAGGSRPHVQWTRLKREARPNRCVCWAYHTLSQEDALFVSPIRTFVCRADAGTALPHVPDSSSGVPGKQWGGWQDRRVLPNFKHSWS
jgi:hypothetical protein